MTAVLEVKLDNPQALALLLRQLSHVHAYDTLHMRELLNMVSHESLRVLTR